MNQKHMDSISLGIHMGLKTKGAGENAFGEEHFRSHQTPCICKQQFEVCDDCVLGWVPFLIIECTGCLAAASQMCPGNNTPMLLSRSLLHGPTGLCAGLPGRGLSQHGPSVLLPLQWQTVAVAVKLTATVKLTVNFVKFTKALPVKCQIYPGDFGNSYFLARWTASTWLYFLFSCGI